MPCTRSRVSGSFEGYYTMTPRSGLNKTAPAAVLHGSMFSKLCAPAQGRVPCTRSRVSGSFEGYYTMTPRSGLNKTAPAAVLHGSMFS
ncbi:hypothetical protein, partial [Ruthenibacterium lactatiformans]